MTSVWTVVVISGLLVGCGGPKERGTPPRAARLQIVYDIDLAKAVDDRARVVQRDLEAHLADRAITAEVRLVSTAPGALTITPSDRGQHAAITDLVATAYADIVAPRPCTASAGVDAQCFAIAAPHAKALERSALAAAVETIRARLATKIATDVTVVARGDQIVIEVPAQRDDMTALRSLFVRTGLLEIKVVDDAGGYPRSLAAHVEADPEAVAAGIRFEVDSWSDDRDVVHVDTYLIASDRRAIERYLADLIGRDPSFALPADRELGFERIGDPPRWRTYYLERTAALTGAAVSNATVLADPNTGQPDVLVEFNRSGTVAFAELTTRVIGQKIAVILDGTIQSAPIVMGPIRGGRASIAMGAAEPAAQRREADELVVILRTGALPAPVREVSSTIVP